MSDPIFSYPDALQCMEDHTPLGPHCCVPLQNALHAVLARPVTACVSVPAFDNSARDGFALDHRDTVKATPETPVRLPIMGEQAAGKPIHAHLQSGTALRIMTGACFPNGATAIVQQEDVREADGRIMLTSPIPEGSHLRRCGEDSQNGATALTAGTPLTAATLGYLASVGVTEVTIYERPRLGIVSTGTELVMPGVSLEPGQTYDCNRFSLIAAAQEFALEVSTCPPVADDIAMQRQCIERMLAENDILLITGGVSVGRHDHVKNILAALDVRPLFWQVKQRPGKPLWVGRRGNKIVFGLPGNSVSALICYYEYGRPAIRKWLGFANRQLPESTADCSIPLTKAPGMTHFLRAVTERRGSRLVTTPYGLQESHCMRPFALANSIIVLPESGGKVSAGEPVLIQWLPPFDHP